MAASSAFSYAQAAKGQGGSTVSSNPPAHTSGSSPALSTNVPVATSVSADITIESSDTSQNAIPGSMPIEKHDNESSVGSEIYIPSDTASEKRPGSKRDGDTGRLDRPWRRAEKDTRSSSATTRSADDHDAAGSHNDTRSKAPEKHCSDQDSSVGKNDCVHEAPKVELLEAPIPPVNIWQQRREAMAKLKPTTTTGDGGVNGASASFVDARKPAKPSKDLSLPMGETASTNGSKQPRKASETAHTERNGSRLGRTTDKETRDSKADLPPAVDDAASWPTPETAVKEKRKPSISNVDRVEKDVKDTSEEPLQHKSRQKEKWITYDYVPSVSFETQLPQMRGLKPRGGARAANGTSRATGTTQVNEKAASTAPMAKATEYRDRPREGGPAPNRTASVPPAVKRASMDVSSFRDQRRASGHASGHAASDRSKDATTSYSPEQNHGSRDRPEGRVDRGRGGGYRRGNHHSQNMHAQHQHGASGYSAGSMASRPQQGTYSPPLRQGGHNQMFMAPSQRGGRGRNGAGANFHRMSLPNGSLRLPAVQTQFGPYEYPVAPLSAMPFQPQPYMDSMVLQMLKGQIEYYFSIENLCKDMFLRKRMDSQGFVNLQFVAAFKRIRELTSDMGMIRAVCESSPDLEFVVGEDEVERIRRRSGWQNFVLPMLERDSLARNNGPVHLTFKSRAVGYNSASPYNGMAPGSYGMSSPLGYNGDTHFQPMTDAHTTGGMANGAGGISQLSAEVPDFSPSGLSNLGGIRSHGGDGNIDKNAGASAGNATGN